MFYTVNAFRAARIGAKLTQKEAAEMLGVHPSTILSWEKGDSVPFRNKLERIAELYHCTIDGLEEECGYDHRDHDTKRGS